MWLLFSNSLPSIFPGAVLEGKPQLVAIRDRVRSDVEGSTPSSGHVTLGETKRVITAANPGAQDAAELLRYLFFLWVTKTSQRVKCLDSPCTIPVVQFTP